MRSSASCGGVAGAADVKLEQTAGLPYLRVRIRRDEIARYGINASQVLDVVRTMGGRPVGEVLEGQRRFLMQVRFTPRIIARTSRRSATSRSRIRAGA